MPAAARGESPLQVFTLHAELEGLRLLDGFEALLGKWQASGASITRMARIHELGLAMPMPSAPVIMGAVPGRSGLLATSP
jgi:hypothetical protein